HPLFMPTLAVLLLMWTDPSLHVELDEPITWIIIPGTIFICTALLPIMFSYGLLRMGRVTSLENANDQDRRTLMLFAELGFLLAYLTYRNVPSLGHTILLLMLGINIAMVVTL